MIGTKMERSRLVQRVQTEYDKWYISNNLDRDARCVYMHSLVGLQPQFDSATQPWKMAYEERDEATSLYISYGVHDNYTY